jgi:hypothetical protein
MMTRSIVRLAMVAAALLVPGRMAAQAPTGPAVGDTVRVAAPALGPGIRGELVAVHGDTMFINRYGATLAVPMSQVERVDVRRQRSTLGAVARGVSWGAPMGFAAGFLLGTAAEGGGNPDCADDCHQLPAIGAASGLAMGIVLGGLIGAISPSGRWVQVYSRRRVALSFDVKL